MSMPTIAKASGEQLRREKPEMKKLKDLRKSPSSEGGVLCFSSLHFVPHFVCFLREHSSIGLGDYPFVQ